MSPTSYQLLHPAMWVPFTFVSHKFPANRTSKVLNPFCFTTKNQENYKKPLDGILSFLIPFYSVGLISSILAFFLLYDFGFDANFKNYLKKT